MSEDRTLIEVHPCDRHRSILSTDFEWFRALQLAEDCMDCVVIG